MHDLLSKYLSGEILPEERKCLLDALRDNPEFKEEAARFQNISGLITLADKEGMASDLSFDSFKRKRRKRAVFSFIQKAGGYAAIMLLSVFCTYLFFGLTKDSEHPVVYQEFMTPPGQRAKVLLADGTVVWLNANSRLRYPEHFDPEKRVVELHGEAFFEVKSDKDKSFIVQTEKMDIKVTGTRFNVFAYDKEKYFIASLVEGGITVSNLKNTTNAYKLHPNQQIVVSDSSSQINQFEGTDFMLWTEGVFVFDDMPLDYIIKKLELYYDVAIVTDNKKLGNFRYTGKFRQRDGVESVLRKLQIVYPFTYKKDDEKNLITLK